MIFFQTSPDIFITKPKKSYEFIQDQIKKFILKTHSLNVLNFFILVRKKIFLTELITEQLLHSEFDYLKNPVIFNQKLDRRL